MTVRPDHCRFQVTIPRSLKARIEETARSAGVSANAVAATWLAQAAARTDAPPVDPVASQRMGGTTGAKKRPKSGAPRQMESAAEEGWDVEPADDWEPGDEGYTSDEMAALLDPADVEALAAKGWTPERIADFLSDI